MSDDIRPFRVEVPEAVLDDLRDRLARTRWPDQIPGIGLGLRHRPRVPAGPLRVLANEVRLARRRKSGSTAGRTSSPTIDGQQIHFIHARSDEPDALPLIITHGWPGSVAEFLDVIEPLPRRTFHVVVPVAARLRLVGPDDRSPAGTCSASPRRGRR